MSITNIQNQKSVLAKLLAQENITVEHKKIKTAYFDPKNRVLALPIWKEMSPDLYDLLVGHEVGHAWETPAKGWHDAIEEKGLGFKSFLNVVEDARIEKLIKNRYPGLRGPMFRGYQELFNKDFFGVENNDLSELTIIDRLNLHFKIGGFLNLPFSDKEIQYVERMGNLQSWDDVYKLALELFEYQKEINETEHDGIKMDDYEDFDINNYGDDEDGNYDVDKDFDKRMDNGSHRKMNTKSGKGCVEDPISETDMAFREKEKSLLSSEVLPYFYVNLPTLNFNDFIIKHNDIYGKISFEAIDNYSSFVESTPDHYYNAQIKKEDEKNIFNTGTLFNVYRNKNMKFINYLVKEFELKRNAAQLARASVSKTGELCMEKVWSYKLREDLFKRVTKIPNGKNHGMIMFVDWSGSMTGNITNTIEQFMVLGDFCRKVNIPFEVFAFSDSRYLDFFDKKDADQNVKYKFSKMPKDMLFTLNLHLMQLLSSRMTKNQYREAQFRLLQIAKIYEDESTHENFNCVTKLRKTVLPKPLLMNGTPLNEAIVVANYFIPWYKEQHKIDVMSTIFLTDGDGINNHSYVDENGKLRSYARESDYNFNLVIKDPVTNLSAVSKGGEPITSGLLRMLKAKSGTNLVGYFISDKNIRYATNSVLNNYGKSVTNDEISKYLKRNKFFSVQNVGYDEYFIIQSKDLVIGDDKLVVNGTAKRDMLKAFINNQKNKILNRVLLNKFIEQIA